MSKLLNRLFGARRLQIRTMNDSMCMTITAEIEDVYFESDSKAIVIVTEVGDLEIMSCIEIDDNTFGTGDIEIEVA